MGDLPLNSESETSPLKQSNQPIVQNTTFTTLSILLFLGSIIILFFVLNYFNIIPLSLQYPNQLGFLPHQYSELQNKLIATVDGKYLFLSDIKKAAREQYQESAINNKVLQIIFDQKVEYMILDREEKKLNIAITNQDVQEKVKNSHPNQNLSSIPNTLLKITKYDMLKEKIMSQQIESREAYIIGFFTSPYRYEQKLSETEIEEVKKQREDGEKALLEIEERLKNREVPLEIAQSIYQKYPSLQRILTVNSYIFESTKDNSLFTQPKVYTYNLNESLKSFYDKFFSMQTDEVKIIKTPEGTGGSVVHLKKVHHADFNNYQEWLTSKKKELVKIHNPL